MEEDKEQERARSGIGCMICIVIVLLLFFFSCQSRREREYIDWAGAYDRAHGYTTNYWDDAHNGKFDWEAYERLKNR